MAQIKYPDTGCPSGLMPAVEETVAADPQAFVRHKGDQSELELAIAGAKCAGCIAKIEGGVKALPGVQVTRLNLSSGKLYVSWSGDLTPQKITEKIAMLGYRATPYDSTTYKQEEYAYGRHLLKCLAVAGFAMTNIMLLSVSVWASADGEMGPGTRGLMHLVSALIAIPAATYAGRPFFTSAWAALKVKQTNMDVPISLAVILAIGYSVYEALHHGTEAYFDAALMLLFFLLIGRWLDHVLRHKAGMAARELIALQAVTANLLRADGTVMSIAAKDIRPGDTLQLMPGDRVPVNSEIIEGISEMDLSLVNGESTPALCQVGEPVAAGVLNISHPVQLRAMATVNDSLIAELARLVEAAQQNKSHFVRIADKAARIYVPVVHLLAMTTFCGWFFIGDAGIRISLMNAIAVLIITCPCALGLATPAVQIVATGRLFQEGILVKSGDALERLAQVTRFVFDKTGTLTLGKLKLLNADSLSETEAMASAALARTSRHPICRAIADHMGAGPIATDVTEVAGQGVRGIYAGQHIKIGSIAFVGETYTGQNDQISTWIKLGDMPAKQLVFEDRLRPDTTTLISKLKNNHYRVSMLSGDRREPVARIAAATGIEDWHAQLTPEHKIELLETYKPSGDYTAMVGDGLNDAPALASAHVSLSPGSAAEAAQSAADFVFQGDSLGSVWKAFMIAKKAQRHIVQNFAFAALYNVIAAPMAMMGHVTPLIAALAMSGSSLLVTLNAIRLSWGTRNI